MHHFPLASEKKWFFRSISSVYFPSSMILPSLKTKIWSLSYTVLNL